MLIIERHRLQKRLLQKHRGLILLATAFALLAVVVDMGWQQAIHMSSSWDLLLQVLMGVAFVAALVFFWVDSSGYVLNWSDIRHRGRDWRIGAILFVSLRLELGRHSRC